MIAIGFVLFMLAVFRVWLSTEPYSLPLRSRREKLAYGFMLLGGGFLMLAGMAIWLYRSLP